MHPSITNAHVCPKEKKQGISIATSRWTEHLPPTVCIPWDPRSSSNNLPALVTVPNANTLSLHRVLGRQGENKLLQNGGTVHAVEHNF